MRRVAPVALLLAVPLLATVPGGGAVAQVDIDPPSISWGPCRFYEEPVECAVVDLPLDYDDPDGPTTPINVARVPATGERIGSLFVNPGGPGGSAMDFAVFGADKIGPGVTEHFDIVGVEPRGVGLNRPPAFCRVPRGEEPKYPPVFYPLTPAQERATIRADRQFNELCAADRSLITDHLSTADYVRDIDVVRQALGEDQLSFYGISYGSIVGQTYAAMFPDRVRAIVVDGVLDPVAWTAGRNPDRPSTYRLRSGEGAYEALVSAFNECDRVGRARCPLAGHANETWHRLYRLAKRGKLSSDGFRITPQDLVGNALFALYSARFIPSLMRFLAQTERRLDNDGRAAARAAASAWDELERIREAREKIGPYGIGAPSYGRWYVGFQAVLCSDAVNPTNPRAWVRWSDVADHMQPWFGRLWTWASSLCAGWPGAGGDDAFRGPWATTTSTPLLVVGNTHDPATPINGARAANRLFEDSVLLTLDGWGHGALGASDCVAKKMAAYLIDQALPPPSRICQPDRPLFPR